MESDYTIMLDIRVLSFQFAWIESTTTIDKIKFKFQICWGGKEQIIAVIFDFHQSFFIPFLPLSHVWTSENGFFSSYNIFFL